jgi:hypothetical protein
MIGCPLLLKRPGARLGGEAVTLVGTVVNGNSGADYSPMCEDWSDSSL